MNSGAVLIEKNFFDTSTIESEYRKIPKNEWKPTWENKKYAGDHWMAIKLITHAEKTPHFSLFSSAEKVIGKFQCKITEMMFYSLLPQGELHPHRDTVGAVGLGGLRFHIPLITNPGVDFRVSGKQVIMNPGELWALDTSYLHSVKNSGTEERVHLVFDVLINDWVRSIIPKPGAAYYLHQGALVCVAAHKAAKTLLLHPSEIKGNLNVAKNAINLFKSKFKRS